MMMIIKIIMAVAMNRSSCWGLVGQAGVTGEQKFSGNQSPVRYS